MPSLAICFCSCRRIPLLLRTVPSVLGGLPAPEGVELYVIDDNSSFAERGQLMAAHPDMTFIFKPPRSAGHAVSLNLMLRSIDTDYLLYWEDDMLLEAGGPWLARAVDILDADPGLASVSLDTRIMQDRNSRVPRRWRRRSEPHEHEIFAPAAADRYVERPHFRYEDHPWPGFSLLPNVLARRRIVSRVGFFDETDRENMEYDFGLRCLRAGLLTAVLHGPRIHHLEGPSAYVLNGFPRSWDPAPPTP